MTSTYEVSKGHDFLKLERASAIIFINLTTWFLWLNNQKKETLHVKNGVSLPETEGLTSAWYFVSGCTRFDSWEEPANVETALYRCKTDDREQKKGPKVICSVIQYVSTWRTQSSRQLLGNCADYCEEQANRFITFVESPFEDNRAFSNYFVIQIV